MPPDTSAEAVSPPSNTFAAADIVAILREREWLHAAYSLEAKADMKTWLTRAAELLGPRSSERSALEQLLSLIFLYDASALLQNVANQAVLARAGSREVIRELANRILDGRVVDSDRFKEIVEGIKTTLPYRSRSVFHPIRLVLAGAAGEGELDRVILLLDTAASLDFAIRVKGTRERVLEFCAALD